ncbi:yjeF N-terminal domain-containing 3 isoform 9-T9 [Spinachia spinachia]
MDKMNQSSAEAEAETIEPLRYLSKGEAAAIETELMRDYRFGQQQLIEIWGQACALAITKEYEPTIYHPQRSSQSLHQDFTVQCEKMDIPSLSYLPTEVQLINDAYNLVIDAMMGPDADCANLREPYPGILVTLKQIKIPIASVDVPSGWDVEEPSQDGINPEVLISLTAPKKCAISFSGKHFLAGRFLPYDIQKKYDLNLPEYPGTDCLIEL